MGRDHPSFSDPEVINSFNSVQGLLVMQLLMTQTVLVGVGENMNPKPNNITSNDNMKKTE